MSVSKFTSSSGVNDFNLNVQAINSTVIFDAEKAQGSYSIVSSSLDNSMDIYAFASDGSAAGFTSGKAFTASRNFNKLVILGGTIGDVLSFSFKTTYPTTQETAETTAGPFILGVSPSSLPNVNSTTTVSGGNFASGITATFTGTDAVSRPAKSVVVGSPQSLIVTRPDTFPVSASPYTLVVSNPGISDPTGTASNVLSNGVTAGAAPSWTTAAGTIATFSKNIPFTTTVVATDADGGSSVTYSVVSGYSLPAGLSLGSSTGIISGTPTTSTGPVSFNLRATDSGGNYVDRSFTLNDSGPVWATTGALTNGQVSVAYTYTLSVSDDSGTTPTFAVVSGSLPAGLSLNPSTGVISGTPTVGSSGTASTFVISATDANGTAVNSSTLSLYVLANQIIRLSGSGTWTNSTGATISTLNVVSVAGGGGGGNYGSNVGCGGGGAGGVVVAAFSNVTNGTSYTYSVGAGGSGGTGGAVNGSSGTQTTFTGVTTAVGGGYGATNSSTGGSGGSGGGGSRGGTSGFTSGQGNSGSGGDGTQYGGGGGGGIGGSGGAGGGGVGGAGGAGNTYYGIVVAGGGGGGYSGGSSGGSGGSGVGGPGGANNQNGSNATVNTGSGGGGSANTSGGNGAAGTIILSYLG
jgi:hypothetical protein